MTSFAGYRTDWSVCDICAGLVGARDFFENPPAPVRIDRAGKPYVGQVVEMGVLGDERLTWTVVACMGHVALLLCNGTVAATSSCEFLTDAFSSDDLRRIQRGEGMARALVEALGEGKEPLLEVNPPTAAQSQSPASSPVRPVVTVVV